MNDSYKILKKKKKVLNLEFTRVSPIIFSKSGEQRNTCQTRALPVGLFDSLIIEQLLIPDIGG